MLRWKRFQSVGVSHQHGNAPPPWLGAGRPLPSAAWPHRRAGARTGAGERAARRAELRLPGRGWARTSTCCSASAVPRKSSWGRSVCRFTPTEEENCSFQSAHYHGCVTAKSTAKDLSFCFCNTSQLKVYRLSRKLCFPPISVATVTSPQSFLTMISVTPLQFVIFNNNTPVQPAGTLDLITSNF